MESVGSRYSAPDCCDRKVEKLVPDKVDWIVQNATEEAS